MHPQLAIAVIFTGLLVGSIFALNAAGVTILYGSIWLPNASNGQFFLLAALVAWWLSTRLDLSFFLIFPVVAIASVPLYWLIERFLFRRFYDYEQRGVVYLFMSMGLAQILSGVFTNSFALISDSFAVQTPFTTMVNIGPFGTTLIRVISLLMAGLLVVALVVFFRWHKIGRALRAVFQDREITEMRGVNIHGLYRFAYIFGSIVITIAGIIYILSFPVDLTLGWTFGVLAFAMMIVGGPGSVMGAMVVGLLFGFTRSIVTLISNPTMANFVFYGVMILTLLVRPMGLFRR
jgi:branched-chain amino acid transport system permease protein